MNLVRFVISGVIVGMLVLAAGCGWFKSSEDIDPVSGGMVPGVNEGVAGGPESVNGLNPGSTSPGGWKNNGPEGLGGANDWTKIPGLNLGTIYFAFDSDRIQESERGKLEQAADYMKKNNIGLIIEGNCDERGSAEYNRGLSERRAIAVQQYLAQLGVQENRCKTIGYGFEHPAVEGHDEAAWSKNRRADLCGAKMK